MAIMDKDCYNVFAYITRRVAIVVMTTIASLSSSHLRRVVIAMMAMRSLSHRLHFPRSSGMGEIACLDMTGGAAIISVTAGMTLEPLEKALPGR